MRSPIDLSKGGRILSIDALRGIAALSIAFAHVSGNILISFEQISNSWLSILSFPFSQGIARVYLFFLISGFCIHLAWCKQKLKSPEEKPKIDFIPFWKRRFWRLYPPYLIALGLYVAADLYIGKAIYGNAFIWDLLSHVFMIHNLDAATTYSFNGQFWTLAIEEQLYLAYFLLIWIRIKFGWKAALGFCLGMRVVWFIFAPVLSMWAGFKIPTHESAMGTWILWAAGALSVEYALGIISLPKFAASFKLAFLTIIACAAWYIFGLINLANNPGILSKIWWLTAQPMWGLAFFFFINAFVSLENRNLTGWQMTLMKIGAWFGMFSYSIYLMCEIVVRFLPGSHWIWRAVVTLGIAYIFHLIFERRFISKPAYLANPRWLLRIIRYFSKASSVPDLVKRPI